MVDMDRDSAGVRFPPPFAFAGTLLLGVAVGKLIGHHAFGRAFHNFGWVALFAGVAILMTAIGLFKSAGIHTRPWKTTDGLITDGVFKWTRNPMYLGMSLIYLGFALVLNSLVALILFVPLIVVIQREVIEREERYMEAKFGEPYRAYKASVRRWV